MNEPVAGHDVAGGRWVAGYLHEGIDVLAAATPGLHGALPAARAAGHTHVQLDETLIGTDRSKAAGPSAGVDLWWSGKHHQHGGNVQVVNAPDGWPLWTSGCGPAASTT